MSKQRDDWNKIKSDRAEVAERLLDDVVVIYGLYNQDGYLMQEVKRIMRKRGKEGKWRSAVWSKILND